MEYQINIELMLWYLVISNATESEARRYCCVATVRSAIKSRELPLHQL